jgi:uncharacterized protein (DUF433 family)
MDRNDRMGGMGFGMVRRSHAAGAAVPPRNGGALGACGAARSPHRGGAARPDRPSRDPAATILPFDATILPRGDAAPEFEPEAACDPSTLWVGRLVFDATISAQSPVVRGTNVTVRRVVSMVVDGRSWAEILRVHPELTEADVRACLAYCVEEEGAGALWAPGEARVSA